MTIYLSNYAHFEDKQAMDNASNQHISANWSQLNKTDRSVLDMIRRYSVKHGAAHLKHETISKALEKSLSTIRRSIVKLSKLNIIERVSTIRRISKGFGANIYAILPVNEQSEMNTRVVVEKVDAPSHQVAKIETEPLSFNLITKDIKDPSQCDTCLLEPSMTLYERFKSLLKSTIGNNDKLASRLYGVYRAQSIRLMRYSIHADKGSLFEDLAIRGLNITTQATKKKTIRNIAGYYSGVLNELFDKSLFADAFMDYDEDIELCVY